MRPGEKEWPLKSAPRGVAERLASDCAMPDLTARLLANRGIASPPEAGAFLRPGINHLHDPLLMADMGRAVERIRRAVATGEKITIVGDYDVDGTTSTIILKKAISLAGGAVDYHIPERLTDGYGLRCEMMESLAARGSRLVISVDTGIRAHAVVEHAASLGLDLIITDHHLPDGLRLPAAYAILNPRRADCRYPEKNLAGCGVAFKIAQALLAGDGRAHLLESFLKIAAIGTIADVVPLVGENRVIARLGLDALSRPVGAGLKALLDGCGLSGKIVRGEDVAFRIAPRINACGRTGSANPVVDLFDQSDPARAGEIVALMEERNSERKRIEALVMSEALAVLSGDPDAAQSIVAVVAGRAWHRGVIGIVAARLAERLARPAIAISIDEDGFGHGSARSRGGYNILAGLESCREMFERFGGHAQAAGFVIRGEKIPLLAESLNEHARAALSFSADLPLAFEIDCELKLAEVNDETLEHVRALEPFGCGNPEPVFAARGVELVEPPRVLKEKHVKMKVRQGSEWRPCIWWGAASIASHLQVGSLLDLAFRISEDTWNNRTEIRLDVKDVAAAC